ncbi:MAG: hypothetical protein OJF49_000676 [Ktedonobacterales bacterium]|jgi:hypothetical protein|nr:MAG: hypothetical protein OJF49_000676 [Ktedonobacterales bacterium]
MASITENTLVGVLVASAPGIAVALVTHWLNLWRESARARLARENARALLMVEITSDRGALAAFWSEINGLDTDANGESTEEHLTAMASAGWLGVPLPEWDFARWEHFPADALSAWEPKELLDIDRFYRTLRSITERYTAMMAIEPEERAELQNRFWANRFAGARVERFKIVARLVGQALDFPLGGGEADKNVRPDR